MTEQKSDNANKNSWNFVLRGYNVRSLEMSGAFGIEQLEKLLDLVTIRRENEAELRNLFGSRRQFRI
jgi:CDP-4-dehydro-6-deoxyglucose reductase, E1